MLLIQKQANSKNFTLPATAQMTPDDKQATKEPNNELANRQGGGMSTQRHSQEIKAANTAASKPTKPKQQLRGSGRATKISAAANTPRICTGYAMQFFVKRLLSYTPDTQTEGRTDGRHDCDTLLHHRWTHLLLFAAVTDLPAAK